MGIIALLYVGNKLNKWDPREIVEDSDFKKKQKHEKLYCDLFCAT
jgi:hypothetical protein